MATRTEERTGAQPDAAARTGEQFLEGLRSGEREVWLNGERITHPLEHEELRAAAESMARVFAVGGAFCSAPGSPARARPF